jgi:hypothetical protein
MEQNDIVEVNDEVVESEPVIEDPKKVLDALDRAKSDAKKYREEKEQIREQMEKAVAQLTDWSAKALIEKVERELTKSGLPNVERVKKYLDFNTIGLDDEFKLTGLNEQLESLKSDFPEIFDPKLLVGGLADGGVTTPVKTANSASELQARILLGK